jgi:hypothetical protein
MTSPDDEAAQPSEPKKRIRAKDSALVSIPYLSLRPVELRWHTITPNEVHASTIGATSGIFAGLAWISGKSELTVMLVFVLAGYAILGRPVGTSISEDNSEYGADGSRVSIAVRTIRHEPWYFLAWMAAVLVGVIVV